MSVNEMMGILRNEKVDTWFDLGIYIDRFRENNPMPVLSFSGTEKEFEHNLQQGGIAFITFSYSIDGVTIEVEKYAKTFYSRFRGITIHYVAGKIYPESHKLIDDETRTYEIPEIAGFDNWPLYKEFFFTRLERGSTQYNELIRKFWDEILLISEKLGNYVEQNNIRLLYVINALSNPGNVSLAVALVFVSEFLGIPVINNNHDFYWEGGNRKIDIKEKGLKHGPRDVFFTNDHLGEVFSIIEVFFPWESRTWINVNINKEQSKHLISINGHNPANVTEIGTSVDTSEYVNISKRGKINAFYQFEKILARYRETLVGYSVNDVLRNNLVNKDNPRPILTGTKTRTIKNFMNENIIFLQPTRIIQRKRIELGFKLIRRMFKNKHFIKRLKSTPNLKLTLIVTGPIALGQFDYFKKLIKRFSQLLDILDGQLRDRVYMAFLFSELDRESFKERFKDPVGIPELYNIASLVLLPSKTEGRGLPIIEASACGTPIFCRRYYPEKVYSEVIGEHLPDGDRLKVIEFDGKKITSKHTSEIIDHVMFPHRFTDEIIHNKLAVEKRFSLDTLRICIDDICHRIWLQLHKNDGIMRIVKQATDEYSEMISFSNSDTSAILKTGNRQYLPGFGRLAFMTNLKSLIDPSAFRMEEQMMKGFIFHFALQLVKDNDFFAKKSYKDINRFFNAVHSIFHYKKGEVKIRHDHSFAYRHRNNNFYPYQEFTLQELTGLVNLLFYKILEPDVIHTIDEISHFFTDWNLALAQLTSSALLAIDDRKELITKMQANIPIGVFPGDYSKYVLEFFALQAVRSRLNLKIETELTNEILKRSDHSPAPVYVFAPNRAIGKWPDKKSIIDYILNGNEKELRLLYNNGILKVVESNQLCVGLHFPQMGEEALRALADIHKHNGFIISNRDFAGDMSDIADIDRFHIGKATHPMTAAMLGIPGDSGYIQYVPAGIRPTIAYPVPVQRANDFSSALKGKLFAGLSEKLGRGNLLNIIKKESEEKGSPVDFILENLTNNKKNRDKDVFYDHVSGIYPDGLPWNGVYAKVNSGSEKWIFKTLISEKTKKVTAFVSDYALKNKIKPQIAWNGGYILNPELVGKLGLPESYIGSPLGLVVNEGEVKCPPLFNKPALFVDKNGIPDIGRNNCSRGLTISGGDSVIKLTGEQYNTIDTLGIPVYYDLLFKQGMIDARDRVIVRLAGNMIKEVIHPGKHKIVKLIPVGLTLSFPEKSFPGDFNKQGRSVKIEIHGARQCQHAVEAGPLLVYNGKVSIDMETEGWKHENSIKTQAARLDYTDMRGPKIAAGIDAEGNLLVLVINGRIRESVGATHADMAEIMLKLGAEKAMGFDPGGSSTLVVNGKTLNISPYNRNYEKNIYSMPPEPRAVSNAVIGYRLE